MYITETDEAQALILNLRELLSGKEKKLTGETLENADRSINLLCAKFDKLSENLAFQSCGVIGTAITKGSKNASKKKPKLIRWSTNEPPSLSELPSAAERAGAVALLKTIKAPWVAAYALVNSAECGDDKHTTSLLLNWIETGSNCSADTLNGVNTFLSKCPDSTRPQVEKIFKQLPALFDFSMNCTTEAYGAAYSSVVASAINAYATKSEYFGKCNPVETLISSCEKSSGLEPHILFNTEVQNALCAALKSISKPSKTTTNAVYKIGNRLLSLAAWHVMLYGKDDSEIILGRLRSIDNDLLLTANSKKSINYSGLLANSESTKTKSVSTIDIYTLTSSLLLAWDDLLQTVSLDKSTDEVTVLLQSIANTLGLARFGTQGQQVSYDPFRHFIDGVPTTNVIVSIPGISVIRTDGSERVLVKAVVNPV